MRMDDISRRRGRDHGRTVGAGINLLEEKVDTAEFLREVV